MKRALIFLGYGVLVVILAGWMYLRRSDVRPNPPTKVETMTWAEIKDGITVPAKPAGIWTWALDYVKGPALIQIEATGDWSYTSSKKKCGPDGDLNAFMRPDSTILPGAPVGALIVKIGGSTAGANDGSVHIAGSRGLVQIDDKISGPVFLTINDELSGLADNDGQLTVKISIGH